MRLQVPVGTKIAGCALWLLLCASAAAGSLVGFHHVFSSPQLEKQLHYLL
jgi:hypothetical protein